MSGLLISFRNLLDGRDESMRLVFCACVELRHLYAHVFLSFFLCSCIAADLLFFRGFLSVLGSMFASDVVPSAASFASLSAILLPSMLTCPAVHLSVRA